MDQGTAGRYRTMHVRVGRYVPPTPEAVSGLMLFSGGVRRAATNLPAFSGRNERGGVAQTWKRRAAQRGATRRSATSSTTLDTYGHPDRAIEQRAGVAVAGGVGGGETEMIQNAAIPS